MARYLEPQQAEIISRPWLISEMARAGLCV